MGSLDVLFQSLEDHGWASSDSIVPPSLTQSLYSHAHQLWQQGFFRPASVGRLGGLVHDPDIRGDAICWLEETSPDTPIAKFRTWAEQLRTDLNRGFFLGLRSAEFHFARYEPGRGYARHVDQHVGSEARKISLVLYLNEEWEPDDGGELCLYKEEAIVKPQPETSPAPDGDTAPATAQVATPASTEEPVLKLLPQAGRLVLFRSDKIPHEVLPAGRVRWSLTGWYRDDDKI